MQQHGQSHWKAFTAAWLGWAFDGLDGYLYVMVAEAFVTQLLVNEHGAGNVTSSMFVEKASIIQALFLVGWAVGGAVFGRMGDRLGRTRVLTLTVLTYAIFTGLSFFSEVWWHLAVFRFIAALGIGGEWAAGSALVAETLPAKHRAWGSAVLQAGYQVGMIAAILTSRAFAGMDPKWVFVVGVAPALLTVWIRKAVPEPEVWREHAATNRPPSIGSLFSPELWKTTVLTTVLTSLALTGVWAFLFFGPQATRQIPEVAAMAPKERSQFAADVTLVWVGVSIVANFVATYAARLWGYRAAFTLFMIGSAIVSLVLMRDGLTRENVWWKLSAVAFFQLGMFALFPLYIPRLFPVMVRTLGAGFSYNVGRLVSAVGTIVAGELSRAVHGPVNALWWVGMLWIPGVFVALVARTPAEDQVRRADETRA
jgi:MFS family permease